MNISSIMSIIVALVIIVVLQKIDGGSLSTLIQPTAFLVVIGGTFCAAFLNYPYQTVIKAIKSAGEVFLKKTDKSLQVIEEILQLSQLTRRHGFFVVKDLIHEIKDVFLKRGMSLAIDINNTQLLYEILSAEIDYEEEQELINSRVFEVLGGYAPTFGIVGAVLGLIQVMNHIQDPVLLAAGIATAFIATLYGVGIANLIFLPIAGHLKLKLREKMLLKEIVLQGILSIHMSEHPAIIEEKLIAYLKFNNKDSKLKSHYGGSS